MRRARATKRRWIKYSSIVLYVSMGTMCVYIPPLMRDFGLAMSNIPNGLNYLLYGGAAYILGIPLFLGA